MSHSAPAMSSLTKNLRQVERVRKSATDEMREATKSTLAACATMHGKTMHKYRVHAHKLLADLVKDVAAQRHDSAKQIMTMAKRQRTSLETGRRKLATDVEKLRSSIRRHQRAVRADLMKAHEIWGAYKLSAVSDGAMRGH
jgi:hypothetical protein